MLAGHTIKGRGGPFNFCTRHHYLLCIPTQSMGIMFWKRWRTSCLMRIPTFVLPFVQVDSKVLDTPHKDFVCMIYTYYKLFIWNAHMQLLPSIAFSPGRWWNSLCWNIFLIKNCKLLRFWAVDHSSTLLALWYFRHAIVKINFYRPIVME